MHEVAEHRSLSNRESASYTEMTAPALSGSFWFHRRSVDSEQANSSQRDSIGQKRSRNTDEETSPSWTQLAVEFQLTIAAAILRTENATAEATATAVMEGAETLERIDVARDVAAQPAADALAGVCG